jgi:hypothetical protein
MSKLYADIERWCLEHKWQFGSSFWHGVWAVSFVSFKKPEQYVTRSNTSHYKALKDAFKRVNANDNP